MKKMTIVLAFMLSAAGVALAQPPAAPSTPASKVDARLAGWLGCWRLEDDLAGTGARMCITPEAGGVRLQTIVGKNKGIDEVVVPDGVARPIADGDCKGTARSEFSADNMRVFRTTDVTCGKEAPRTVKSVAFLAPGPAWIHVQHVSGERAMAAVRVEHYRRAANQRLVDGSEAPQPPPPALNAAADNTRWGIDDVIEASGKIPAEAVQAALAELKYGFDLNKKTLLSLGKGGVRPEVIDLMVALTYPDKFVVQRRTGGASLPIGISTGTGWFDPFMGPAITSIYADCYSPFGYGYRTYYSMCGMYSPYAYSYYGFNYGLNYPYYYGNYYGWVNVGPPTTGVGVAEPQPEGRVVKGMGFTQIRNRDPEPAPRVSGNGGNGGAWVGAGSQGSGVSSSNGFSSGSPSSGSSGGASGGSDSGARVAVPKGGGGQ